MIIIKIKNHTDDRWNHRRQVKSDEKDHWWLEEFLEEQFIDEKFLSIRNTETLLIHFQEFQVKNVQNNESSYNMSHIELLIVSWCSDGVFLEMINF